MTDTRPVESLRPNPLNPRGELDPAGLQELADSIRAQGVLQPLLVTPDNLVVAGHRRLAAARLAGLADVPVLVRQLAEAEQIEIMLTENVQREALTAVQEARAYRQLLDRGYTRAQVIRRVGINHPRLQARLQLLQLDDEVQRRFERGELPLTLVPILARVQDVDQQRRLATIAGRRRLTVPQLETIVERGAGALNRPPPRAQLPPDEAPKAAVSQSRLETLAELRRDGEVSLSLDRLADLCEATCCACGMGHLPDICSACPLMELMQTVRRRAVA